MTIQQGDRNLGTLYLDLFSETVPKTVANFVSLLQRPVGQGYKGCTFHRIIPGFMAQGGDYTNGDGTGDAIKSFGGSNFPDENFIHKHDRAGILSMANSGPNTNGSQFFITFKATPHLNGKHVVFGSVDLTQSADVLDVLERVKCQRKDRPSPPVRIVDCGTELSSTEQHLSRTEITAVTIGEVKVDQETDDPDELCISNAENDNENDEDDGKQSVGKTPANAAPTTKAEAIKLRLRKLKQRMNQARQLNKQAVQEEGERMTDPGKERRRRVAEGKQSRDAEWQASHAKAIELAAGATNVTKHNAATSGDVLVTAKALTEPAAESVRTARARAEKDKLNRYHINDYHNSEGQHRNYLRNLKSIPQQLATNDDTEVMSSGREYNPLDDAYDQTILATTNSASARGIVKDEREGARRIATELHRRIAKSQQKDRKRKQRELNAVASGEDTTAASGINLRNQRFNAKINRTYDKQTAEIRHNLERGTAL